MQNETSSIYLIVTIDSMVNMPVSTNDPKFWVHSQRHQIFNAITTLSILTIKDSQGVSYHGKTMQNSDLNDSRNISHASVSFVVLPNTTHVHLYIHYTSMRRDIICIYIYMIYVQYIHTEEGSQPLINHSSDLQESLK